MRRANPWRYLTPRVIAEQGRATITLGLQAGTIKFKRSDLVALVGSMIDASIIFTVGVTRSWGREGSAQVVLYNTGVDARGKLRKWRAFADYVRRVAQRLAYVFAQYVTLLELYSPTYGYAIETWDNARVGKRKRAIARARAGRSR